MKYFYLNRFVCLAFAVAACLLGFVSCSDDEPFSDNNIVVPPTTDTIPSEGVVIGDENLRAALLALLQTDELTTENLATVTTLSLRAKNYSTLEGISALVNLDSLTIDNNIGKAFIEFPAEIASMKNLTYLKASSVFRGTLPDSLSGFTYFSVGESFLGGNIPPRLMDLSAERITLNISRSRFMGLPVDIWRKLCADVEKYQMSQSLAPQAAGYFLSLYDPDSALHTQYHADGDFEIYQTHSKGNGINMFILCDGFDYSCNAVDGIAEKVMKFSVEQMFAIEPMTSLRDYFDIYLVYVESPKKGMTYSSDGETNDWEVETKFGTHQPNVNNRYYLCDTPGILDFIAASTGISPWGGIVMLVAHNMVHGGSAGMEYVSDRTSFSVSTIEPKFAKTVWHESVGHSIGWLADEYVESDNAMSEIPSDTRDYYVSEYDRWDYGRNMAFTHDTASVWWADFIGDERYADEKIGLYEGGNYWGKGVWRPTENSIMRTYDRDQQFSAPCRAVIYKEVMTRALGEEFTYSYEDFVKFDMKDAYYPLAE